MVFRAFDGTVPQHFYGEMSKTELGCQVLQEKGHCVDFAHFIRQHGRDSDDPEVILKLKSILWAVVSYLTIAHFVAFICTPRVILARRTEVFPSLKRKR